MKARLVILVSVVTLAFGTVGLLMATLSASASSIAAASNTTWIDNFANTSLDSHWSWVRENPTHWSLTANPGFLRITTEEGSLWAEMISQRNLLLMIAPQGDFTVTTNVAFTPTQFIHKAGLIVYQDDDNYIQLNRQFVDANIVEMIMETNASPTYTAVSEVATLIYLRIQKQGSVYTGYYSLTGTNWTQVGQYTANLDNPKVGIQASNELPGMPEIPADFDFFQLDDATRYLFMPLVVK